MTLPLLISVPHAGLAVPPEVEPLCILTRQQIIDDGDEGARDLYDLENEAAAFVTTGVARAVVDVNRAEDDRRKDGVVKTHTCWEVRVYRKSPTEDVIERLLARYYRPYHVRLRELARSGVRLGVDCHTMAAKGPPIGPDAGAQRPWICLSNADGTCPQAWLELLAASFEQAFDHPVSVNTPFRGGHIIRSHATELPWVQLEVSRAPFMPNDRKRSCVLAALDRWCEEVY